MPKMKVHSLLGTDPNRDYQDFDFQGMPTPEIYIEEVDPSGVAEYAYAVGPDGFAWFANERNAADPTGWHWRGAQNIHAWNLWNFGPDYQDKADSSAPTTSEAFELARDLVRDNDICARLQAEINKPS